jgi:hypothetical protein
MELIDGATDELVIPYTVTIYKAIEPTAPNRAFVGYYETSAPVMLTVFGSSEEDVREKCRARNAADVESMIRFLGGREAAKERREATIAARKDRLARKAMEAGE